MKTPEYYCVICGADMYAAKHCTHNFQNAPAFCNSPHFRSTHHEGGPGSSEWAPCPGHASSKPPGSCPCSCHIRVSDEEIETAREKLERMLEEMNGST